MKNKRVNNKIKGILYSFILLVQISLAITVFILEKLTTKKAGVMRHIHYRRLEFDQGLFFNNNLTMHSFLVIALGILFTVLLIFAVKKRKNKFLKIQLAIGLILSFLVTVVIKNNYFIDMLSYPYFIIAFELLLALQIIVILSSYVNEWKIKNRG